jgi:spoIIIJ-associated protein
MFRRSKKKEEPPSETAEAQQVLQRILEGMGVEATIESFNRDDRLVLNAVCTPDDSMVIGRRGKTLEAIQFLVNRIVHRNNDEAKPILVDVSGYRERRRRNLIDLARRSAERVKETGYQVIVGPYNAYERHILHSSITEDPVVTTESLGEGDQKKVVFKKTIPENQSEDRD